MVTLDAGHYYAIVTPNRSHAILPLHYLHRLLEDPESDQTSLLLYNVLKAGDLPPAGERAYQVLE